MEKTLKLIHKTAIPFVIMIALIMTGIAYLSSNSLEHALIFQDFDRIRVVAINALSLETGDDHHDEGGEELLEEASGVSSTTVERTQILEARDFLDPNTPEARVQFHRYVEEFKDPIVKEINVFDGSGKIIVSNVEQKSGSYVNTEVLKVFEGEAFYLIREENSSDMILTYVPFVYDGKVMGAVEVKSQLAHVLGPISNEMNRISLYLAVFGLFALGMFYLIERHFIIKPIHYLKTRAESIGEGELDEPVDLRTSDELGLLANFFDRMRINIKSSLEKITKFNEELAEKVKERTAELQAERAKLVASLESLKFGFIIIDREKNIILSNTAAEEILGTPKGKLDFSTLENYFGESYKVGVNFDQAINDRKALITPEVDSHNKFLTVLLAPVISENHVIGSILVIEDVTEEALLKRKKEEFFAVASHELRTPLTSIRGNLSLIKDYYKDKIQSPEVLEMVSQAHLSSIQLLNIVNDFLDASKLEQGRGSKELEKVDILKITKTVINDLANFAKNKNLTLVLDAAENLPLVLGDDNEIKEVVYNLVGNALNYTEKGEVRIEIKLEGERVKTVVRDTGIGIAAQNQKLLFKKFQQAGKSYLSRTTISGTGMGLYISKLLIENMHGEIGLLSSSETGSAFYFTIPIAK